MRECTPNPAALAAALVGGRVCHVQCGGAARGRGDRVRGPSGSVIWQLTGTQATNH